MKRNCDSCGEVVGEDKLIVCPKCGGSLKSVDQPGKQDFPPEVLERIVKSVWRRVMVSIFGGFSVLTIVGLILYAYSMQKAYQKGMEKVEQDISKAITDEFKTDRIKATVQSVAQEQSVAILVSNVMPVVATFTNQTTEFRKEMASQVAQTAKELENVKQTAEFASVVTRAQNDDCAAFRRLTEISNDHGHPYGRIAGEAIMAIALDPKLYNEGHVDWQNFHTDPADASLQQLDEVYKETYAEDRPRVLQAIWSSDKISKFNKIQYLMLQIEHADSVRVLRAACDLVENEAKIGGSMLDPMSYSKWWESAMREYPEYEAYRFYQAVGDAWMKQHPDPTNNETNVIPKEFVLEFRKKWHQVGQSGRRD